MSNSEPILVTGAAGQVGGIGGRIVELLRAADTPVRALVRRDDEQRHASGASARKSSSRTSLSPTRSFPPWTGAGALTSAWVSRRLTWRPR
jgi:NAD(P)-dependent dehydrogenase (short-subunit alcohol dehydrogenase family)